MLATFRDIASIAAGDGLTFDNEALRVDPIREDLEYGGLRLRTTAAFAGARTGVVMILASATRSSPASKNSTCQSCSNYRRRTYVPTPARPSSPP